MTIGERIAMYRRALGYSRTYLARLMNLTTAQITAFEEDTRDPTNAEWRMLMTLLPPARKPRPVVTVTCCGPGCLNRRTVPQARYQRTNAQGRPEGPCVQDALHRLGWQEMMEVRLVGGARQLLFVGWLCPACVALQAEQAAARVREKAAAQKQRKREMEQRRLRAERKAELRRMVRGV